MRVERGSYDWKCGLKEGQSYGLTLSLRLMLMRWDIQIGASMTGRNLGVYSMCESFGYRLSLYILCDVLSWMIDVVNWLFDCYVLNDVSSWLIEIFWINSLPFFVCVMCLFLSVMILFGGASNIIDDIVEVVKHAI